MHHLAGVHHIQQGGQALVGDVVHVRHPVQGGGDVVIGPGLLKVQEMCIRDRAACFRSHVSTVG